MELRGRSLVELGGDLAGSSWPQVCRRGDAQRSGRGHAAQCGGDGWVTAAALADRMDLAAAGPSTARERTGRTRPAGSEATDPAADRLGSVGAAAEGVRQPLWVRLRDGSSGEALNAMGAAFGQSFTGVRLADDPTAHREAGAERAVAFTRSGPDEQVSFSAGGYAPGTRPGAYTLAHASSPTWSSSGTAPTPTPVPAPGGRWSGRPTTRPGTCWPAGPPAWPRPARPAGRNVRGGRPCCGRTTTTRPRPARARRRCRSRWCGPWGWTRRSGVPWRSSRQGPPRRWPRQVGAFFFVGRTIRLYRGGVLRATVRLADDAAQAAAGIYRAGPGGTAEQLHSPTQPDGTERTSWLGAGADDPCIGRWTRSSPEDRQTYLDEVGAAPLALWIRLQSRAPGRAGGSPARRPKRGEGPGSPSPGDSTAAQMGDARCTQGWSAGSNAEQRRIAELASTTLGDQRPGVPAADCSPWRACRSGWRCVGSTSPARRTAHRPPSRSPSTAACPGATRSTTASGDDSAAAAGHGRRRLGAGALGGSAAVSRTGRTPPRSTAARDVAAELPIGLPGTEPRDPEMCRPNAPAYPALIHNWGPADRGHGATRIRFRWSSTGRSRVSGAGPPRSPLRAYQWRLYRINEPRRPARGCRGRSAGSRQRPPRGSRRGRRHRSGGAGSTRSGRTWSPRPLTRC